MSCAWCKSRSKPLALATPAGEDICIYCVVAGMRRAADRLARNGRPLPSTPAVLAAYRDAAAGADRGGQARDPWPFTGHRSMADIMATEDETP